MEILGKLGIDIHLLIAQIINFVILLFILNKFVYKPILEEIKKNKDQKINNESEIKNREQEVEKKLKELENEVKKSKKEASEIILEAENLAKKIKEKALRETREEKERVIMQIKSRNKNNL